MLVGKMPGSVDELGLYIKRKLLEGFEQGVVIISCVLRWVEREIGRGWEAVSGTRARTGTVLETVAEETVQREGKCQQVFFTETWQMIDQGRSSWTEDSGPVRMVLLIVVSYSSYLTTGRKLSSRYSDLGRLQPAADAVTPFPTMTTRSCPYRLAQGQWHSGLQLNRTNMQITLFRYLALWVVQLPLQSQSQILTIDFLPLEWTA